MSYGSSKTTWKAAINRKQGKKTRSYSWSWKVKVMCSLLTASCVFIEQWVLEEHSACQEVWTQAPVGRGDAGAQHSQGRSAHTACQGYSPGTWVLLPAAGGVTFSMKWSQAPGAAPNTDLYLWKSPCLRPCCCCDSFTICRTVAGVKGHSQAAPPPTPKQHQEPQRPQETNNPKTS